MGGWLYLSSVYRDKYRAYKKSLIRKCLAQGASRKMSRNVKNACPLKDMRNGNI